MASTRRKKPPRKSPKSPPAAPAMVERRRRARIHSTTQGWLIPDTMDALEPWEVLVHDISRHGVGFQTTEKMQNGEICRIRIGRGPMRLARRIRVVSCRAGAGGHYVVGGEFVAPQPLQA